MRISDWSSDVCSSDLCPTATKSLMTILWSSPSRCDSCDGRITHELLVSLTTSPSTGAATAMAALRGKGCSVLAANRSEEHTSELQSLMRISYAVFCLTKNKSNNESNILTRNIIQQPT